MGWDGIEGDFTQNRIDCRLVGHEKNELDVCMTLTLPLCLEYDVN